MTDEQRIAEEMRKSIDAEIDAMFLGGTRTFSTANAAPDKPLTKEGLMQAIERAQRLMQTPRPATTERGAAKFAGPSIGGFGPSVLAGFNLISNVHMMDRIQRRTHRRTRINKKWLKRYGYRTVPKKDLIQAGNTLYGHPLTIQRVENLLTNGVKP